MNTGARDVDDSFSRFTRAHSRLLLRGTDPAKNPTNGEVWERIAQRELDRVKRIYGNRMRVSGCRKTCYAIERRDGILDLKVPDPSTLAKLRVFIHECQHAILGHSRHSYDDTFPLSRMEYEAERETFGILRSNGIGVTDAMRRWSQQYVAAAVSYDIAHKVEPDRRAVDYAGRYIKAHGSLARKVEHAQATIR